MLVVAALDGGSIGAVLQQTDRDGNVRPVGFYSRKLTPAEGRYGTYDRELVGLRDGCLHFRYQLLGVPFTVRTDHSSLRWLLSQPELTAIRQRWLAVLSQFQMTEISHVKGSDNVVADALSRYPEETGQSYDHLLPDEHDMDLVCAHFFNLSSGLSMDDFGSLSQDDTVPHVDVSLDGNGDDLLNSSTTPQAYSENVLEDLTLPLDPVSKLCLNGYDLSFISADLEARTFIEAYPKCSDFQKQFETLS